MIWPRSATQAAATLAGAYLTLVAVAAVVVVVRGERWMRRLAR